MPKPKQVTVTECENGFIARTNTFHGPFDDDDQELEKVFIETTYLGVEQRLDAYFNGEEKKHGKTLQNK